jgi:hypothetical protein
MQVNTSTAQSSSSENQSDESYHPSIVAIESAKPSSNGNGSESFEGPWIENSLFQMGEPYKYQSISIPLMMPQLRFWVIPGTGEEHGPAFRH